MNLPKQRCILRCIFIYFTELSLFILTTTLQILRCNESQRRSVLYLITFNLIAESAVNRTSCRKFDQFQKKMACCPRYCSPAMIGGYNK